MNAYVGLSVFTVFLHRTNSLIVREWMQTANKTKKKIGLHNLIVPIKSNIFKNNLFFLFHCLLQMYYVLRCTVRTNSQVRVKT